METTVSKELIPIEKRELIDQTQEYYNNIPNIKDGEVVLWCVKTKEEYTNSRELCKVIKGKSADLLSTRKTLTKPYKDDAIAIEKEFNPLIDKLNNVRGKIDTASSIWFQAEERKRLLEERKRQAEVEEKKRLETEREEKERKKADEYREQGKEKLADKAEARADDHADQAINTVAAEVDEVKVKGLYYRTDYEVKVIDKEKAVNSCMASQKYQNHVILDLKALAIVAKANNGVLDNLDGLEVITKKTPIDRSK